MAFPTNGIRDSFERANDTDIGGSTWSDTTDTWAGAWFGLADLDIVSGNCKSTGSASGSQSTGTAYGANVEAYIQLVVGISNFQGVFLRWNTTGEDGYYLSFDAGTDLLIFRIDDNVETQLGATISLGFDVGDSIGADMIGTTLTAYLDNETTGSWASLGTRTDATYSAAGRIGLFFGDTTGEAESFGGGTVIAAAGLPVGAAALSAFGYRTIMIPME